MNPMYLLVLILYFILPRGAGVLSSSTSALATVAGNVVEGFRNHVVKSPRDYNNNENPYLMGNPNEIKPELCSMCGDMHYNGMNYRTPLASASYL